MFQTMSIRRTRVTRSLQAVMSLRRHLSLFCLLLQQPLQSITAAQCLVSWSWMRLFSALELEGEMDVLPAARTVFPVLLYTLIALYCTN